MASSAILTQIFSIRGSITFDKTYSRAKRKIQAMKHIIDVDMYRTFERGALYTNNKEMQERFNGVLNNVLNTMQLKIDCLKVSRVPEGSLVKIEVFLLNAAGGAVEECWHCTPDALDDNMLSIFESQTKELNYRTEFRDCMLLKLPVTEKVSQYKHYSLVCVVKIAWPESDSNVSKSNRIFRSGG